MNKPLVKICGITNRKDAEICLGSGADMLGFIFYNKSPRFATPNRVKDIIKALKKKFTFTTVGVFVNPTEEYVKEVLDITDIDILQFHGEEPPHFIDKFNRKKIKAFRVKEKSDINRCADYQNVNFLLLDAFSEDSYGGTGKVFNWELLEDFKFKDRLFLSGGINSSNVAEALNRIMPFALDLSSSVEDVPGKKNRKKVEEFFKCLNCAFIDV